MVAEDYYYAWQIAMIVAHLHDLRRKRLARYVVAGTRLSCELRWLPAAAHRLDSPAPSHVCCGTISAKGRQDTVMDAEGRDDSPASTRSGTPIRRLSSFLALLAMHGVEVVVDVRSAPYSRYAPQFDKRALDAAVVGAGMRYLYLGKELGGRPDGAEFYDPDGRAIYSRVEVSPLFLGGIERLMTGIQRYRVAIVCSEENPAGCHRHLLVGHALDSTRRARAAHPRRRQCAAGR